MKLLTCVLVIGLMLGCAAKKRGEYTLPLEPPTTESGGRVFAFADTPHCIEYEPCFLISGKTYVLEVRIEPMSEVTGVWLLPRSEEYRYLLLYEVEECPCKRHALL